MYGPLTTRQVRLGKSEESEKGCWDENRGSSAALASSQRLFLLEESSAVFLERGESMFRELFAYTIRT